MITGAGRASWKDHVSTVARHDSAAQIVRDKKRRLLTTKRFGSAIARVDSLCRLCDRQDSSEGEVGNEGAPSYRI